MVNIADRPFIYRCTVFAASLGFLYTITSFLLDIQRSPIDPTQSAASADPNSLSAANSTGPNEPPFQIFTAEKTTNDVVSS